MVGTLEDNRTVLNKTKLLDGTNPNTNPIQLFYAFLTIVHDLQTRLNGVVYGDLTKLARICVLNVYHVSNMYMR